MSFSEIASFVLWIAGLVLIAVYVPDGVIVSVFLFLTSLNQDLEIEGTLKRIVDSTDEVILRLEERIEKLEKE